MDSATTALDTPVDTPHAPLQQLPVPGLLALAFCAFITLLTEIMPAGLLSDLARGMGVSESLAGQFITAYAAGALIAALPLTWMTQGIPRRTLLILAMTGFGAVNLVTACSGSFPVSLVARFLAGVCGGIVWSLLAGYAARMSPAHLGGRAIAISGAGATVALVLGVPLGSLLGSMIGWQGTFGVMSVLALAVIVWIRAILPDYPGQTKEQRQSLTAVLCMNGIRPVLTIVMTFIAAHNILYIYIEPLLQPSGLAGRVDLILFIFGLGSILSLWVTGLLVDRHLPWLATSSVMIFGLAALAFALRGNVAALIYPIVIAWGIAVGGFATITQTALSRFAGSSVDMAQAMYTTAWNTAVAIGGLAGGALLGRLGTAPIPWVVDGILVATLAGVILAMNRSMARV